MQEPHKVHIIQKKALKNTTASKAEDKSELKLDIS